MASFEECCTAAEAGDAVAQCEVGMCYIMDDGVAQDTAEAVKWFRLSAEQGNAAAQWLLGMSYDDGQGGLSQDSAEAVKWFPLPPDRAMKMPSTT